MGNQIISTKNDEKFKKTLFLQMAMQIKSLYTTLKFANTDDLNVAKKGCGVSHL